MTDSRSTESLIRNLGAGLMPVRRAASPNRLTLVWLGVASLIAAGLSLIFDMDAMMARLASATDLWLAALGALLTALLAAKAAFELGVPGRSRLWALLPLPAALLWIGASGMGCLRNWAESGWQGGEDLECLRFILGTSIPLAVAIVVLLRRVFPLYPMLTAGLAGLACAAASAALLNIGHPFDATATDLAAHAAAVALVTLALTVSGGRLLRR
ncbi:NrsF family protein [Emcibacter sp. SYSU 3D8]|uniref:NrsF family protein n=1 Tax=Emcibacter sp. SYSU 3D8 TaxID=3133969 RepID=UPI0031FEB050